MACAMETVAQVGADWYHSSVPVKRARCPVADSVVSSVPRSAFHSAGASLHPPLRLILVRMAIWVSSVKRFIVVSRYT